MWCDWTMCKLDIRPGLLGNWCTCVKKPRVRCPFFCIREIVDMVIGLNSDLSKIQLYSNVNFEMNLILLFYSLHSARPRDKLHINIRVNTNVCSYLLFLSLACYLAITIWLNPPVPGRATPHYDTVSNLDTALFSDLLSLETKGVPNSCSNPKKAQVSRAAYTCKSPGSRLKWCSQ